MEKEVFKIGSIEIRITISIGVAQYAPDYNTFGEMMLVSDRALYEAKANGRNRVILGSI